MKKILYLIFAINLNVLNAESIEEKLFNIDSLKNTFSGDRKNILRMCPDCRTVEAVKEVEKGWEP